MESKINSMLQRARSLYEKNATPDARKDFDQFVSRRRFLRNSGSILGLSLSAHGIAEGVFGRGLLPVAWAETNIPGKDQMTLHNDRPVNGEFAPHLLNDDITPISRHFIRNNAALSEAAAKMDASNWQLQIDGAVKNPFSITLPELKKMPSKTLALVVECGGNGRALFDPPVRGNPWGRGAIGCAKWTGVPLKDLLIKSQLKDSALYTAHYGDDIPLGTAAPFSRGIPIAKALEEHTLVAYAMNDEPIPSHHGFPVRLVVPGWIGSCSQKWLNRISILTQVHDSPKMTGYSYRVPKKTVIPGQKPPKKDMEIATAWQIKSLITTPQAGTRLSKPGTLIVEGHAWAGEDKVEKVAVSTDFGATWTDSQLLPAPNKYAWQRFSAKLTFPEKGYFEVWARATDDKGKSQPFQQAWNPKGYLGNVMHRIPIYVGVDAHG